MRDLPPEAAAALLMGLLETKKKGKGNDNKPLEIGPAQQIRAIASEHACQFVGMATPEAELVRNTAVDLVLYSRIIEEYILHGRDASIKLINEEYGHGSENNNG